MRRRFIRFGRRRSTTFSDSRISTSPETGGRPSVVTLEENYRSTQGVLDAANALIAEGARQYRKVLRTTQGRPDIRRDT